ncbi:MAG: riboflavin biosynthesis protein RibF [Myxococcota bacterium]
MKLFGSLEAAGDGSLAGSALCLGNFDGVHRGHRALFDEARRHGPVVAVTFSPHPGKVLKPDLAPRCIATSARKLELLEEAGVSAAIVQPFSLEYAKTPPAAFEAALFDGVKAGWVVVGHDFTYGAARAGTAETLERAARARGAGVSVVPAVTIDGVVVSSSKIREYILEGRVEAAALLLGRPFDLDGAVVPGAGRGRTIGFPTANIDTPNELRPAAGVYAVRVREQADRPGPWFGAAANIGVKPTFGGTEVTIEAHLFDFDGDLYGKRVRVQFLERLRAEKRFGSASELAGQIARDLEAARAAVARAG